MPDMSDNKFLVWMCFPTIITESEVAVPLYYVPPVMQHNKQIKASEINSETTYMEITDSLCIITMVVSTELLLMNQLSCSSGETRNGAQMWTKVIMYHYDATIETAVVGKNAYCGSKPI